MMTFYRLLCLWPGLARLWLRGEFRGLVAAVGFAGLINAVFISTLIWPEIAPLPLRSAAIVAAGLWWVIAAAMTLLELPEIVAATDGDPLRGLFVAAQAEYLKGNWIEAEASLRKLLRQNPRDAEAQLLWATLMRRTARLDKARQTLQDLSRLEAASLWQHEIRTERELVRRMTEQQRLSQAEDVVAPATEEVAAEAETDSVNPVAGKIGVTSDTAATGSAADSPAARRRAA
jgi:tetratricopeptide (TPR) repeat protein